MAKKQFQQTIHEPVSSKRLLGAAVALIIFFLLLMSVIRLADKFFTIKARSKELKEEQATLTSNQNELVATNSFLSTPEGTEESLRERYDYLKPGEEMIIVSPNTEATPPPAPQQTGVAYWWDELLRGLGLRKSP
ncbi:MAG TPA: hypothetical protein VL576_03295 [Candidatus Paceibacterota bacterium]|jgi:cell division protein FtsB|nr:hypothetical protein [Candidatus Paceibacterota bacterium]